MAKTDYKVGNLVYGADIYDGLNTSLADWDFYRNGCLKIRKRKMKLNGYKPNDRTR